MNLCEELSQLQYEVMLKLSHTVTTSFQEGNVRY